MDFGNVLCWKIEFLVMFLYHSVKAEVFLENFNELFMLVAKSNFLEIDVAQCV